MNWDHVQALLLRPSRQKAVMHLLLQVTPGRGPAARQQLQSMLQDVPLTIGDAAPAKEVHCTVGFSYRGLEALGMPREYLRVFSRLAPAFKQGAPLRAAQLGDTGESAPAHWGLQFGVDRAHVLITLHAEASLLNAVDAAWLPRMQAGDPLVCTNPPLRGQRLGNPGPPKVGEWVHFGYRDGLVDHHIRDVPQWLPPHGAKHADVELIDHAAGEFLLGRQNDNGYNPFSLPLVPEEVRCFFRDSSFGVLRPMRQDVEAFEQAVTRWQRRAHAELGHEVDADWIKAKLCGRWPTGEPIAAGEFKPGKSMQLDFTRDPHGTGCPWFAHVRRMDPRGHPGPQQRTRTLLRRGMPYGLPNWKGTKDAVPRGLLGLFFCASLEDQFEQLLGQWASGSPPGGPAGNYASDPLAGQHEDPGASAIVPLPQGGTLQLTGFRNWTTTLGTAYTWHPHAVAVDRILAEDYLPADETGPWL